MQDRQQLPRDIAYLPTTPDHAEVAVVAAMKTLEAEFKKQAAQVGLRENAMSEFANAICDLSEEIRLLREQKLGGKER